LKWIIKCTDCVYNDLIYTIRRVKILIWRDHTFDVKTCFQQNRYVFDVFVTSWALFVFCISWNFARDIWTVFEKLKHEAIYGTNSSQFFLWHWRRIACTEFFSWYQCTQTVFKINTIIYRNISYLLMNFITWSAIYGLIFNESLS
jgi:hypothetical protein